MSIRKIYTGDATKDEWLQIRSSTIGGSEAGAICGLSPYASPFSVWCEHTGRSKPFEGNLATDVGTYLEEFVAKKFEETTGLEVKRSNYIYFNDDYPNQHATPDRVLTSSGKYGLQGLKCGLEIKTTNVFGRFKDDAFPEIYYAQCVQYLSVMEYDIWFLAVLVGNREFHIYEMRRDANLPTPEFVDGSIVADKSEMVALRNACDAFMEMVKTDKPPLADGADSTTEALNEIYPQAEEESAIDFNDDQNDLVEELARLMDEQKILDGEIERLKNIVKSDMGANEKANAGEFIVTWKNSFSGGIDSKRLKAERPEIYSAYYKKTPNRRFGLKKGEKNNG